MKVGPERSGADKFYNSVSWKIKVQTDVLGRVRVQVQV